MSHILRLDPPIPLSTPKGNGYAHFLIDEGIENHFFWMVFINETGEIWTFPNTQVRAEKNISLGRYLKDEKWEGIRRDWNKPKDS